MLLIEILSPSNQAKTWTGVWAYTTISAVQGELVLESGWFRAPLADR